MPAETSYRPVDQASGIVDYQRYIDAASGQRLAPALAVDVDRLGQGDLRGILMQAFVTERAIEASLEKGLATFQSRSRGLWTKGESSGNSLPLRPAGLLSDGQTIIMDVAPRGPACHNDTLSCFQDELIAGSPLRVVRRTDQIDGSKMLDSQAGDAGPEAAVPVVSVDSGRLARDGLAAVRFGMVPHSELIPRMSELLLERQFRLSADMGAAELSDLTPSAAALMADCDQDALLLVT